MKFQPSGYASGAHTVTLHARVWIEIVCETTDDIIVTVTLHERVWIEIIPIRRYTQRWHVTLHARVWIEISGNVSNVDISWCHPPREGVD